jgi:hypothetical protein
MGSNADYRPTMVQLPLRLAKGKWTIECAGAGVARSSRFSNSDGLAKDCVTAGRR